MLSAPVGRSRDLELAVERARRAGEDAGELDLPNRPFTSRLTPELQAVSARWIANGTLAQAIAAVAAGYPELA